jgi:hypothetical protein
VASTTTTSITSRLAALAIDFHDKLHDQYEDSIQEGKESESSYGHDDDHTQSESKVPPFQHFLQLFIIRGNHPLQLKRLTATQVEDFKQNGYVIVDNFINTTTAHQIKMQTASLYRKG